MCLEKYDGPEVCWIIELVEDGAVRLTPGILFNISSYLLSRNIQYQNYESFISIYDYTMLISRYWGLMEDGTEE